MGIKILWEDRSKTVMRQVYEGRWTVDDYRNAVDTTRKLLNGLGHTVHIIVDVTASARTPSNLLSVMRYVETQVAPNQGMVVVVGADAYTQSILSIAKRIAPRATGNTSIVNSLEDARAMIGRTPVIPA